MSLAASAAGAQPVLSITLPCIAQPDAENVVQALLPELIENVGQLCATRLPATSLVRQTTGPFITKYRAEADTAWGRAQPGLARLAGPDLQQLLGTAMARPLLASLITPALTRNVQPTDCPSIDRIVTLLEPLPARNTAPLFVSILQLVDTRRTTKPSRPTLRICSPGHN